MARRISLVLLIVFAVSLIACEWVWGNHVWAMVFGALTAVVLVAEGYAYIRYKKTISTIYGEFLVQHRAKGYAGLVLFGLAMASLIVHLGAYSKDEKK